jgi:hypothetical protein
MDNFLIKIMIGVCVFVFTGGFLLIPILIGCSRHECVDCVHVIKNKDCTLWLCPEKKRNKETLEQKACKNFIKRGKIK